MGQSLAFDKLLCWRVLCDGFPFSFFFFLFFFFVARLVNLLVIYEYAEELAVLIFGDLDNGEVVLSEQKPVRIVRLDFVWQH